MPKSKLDLWIDNQDGPSITFNRTNGKGKDRFFFDTNGELNIGMSDSPTALILGRREASCLRDFLEEWLSVR